ncbi:group XIIA secretory phospholipase A2-like [Pollicipes pollicipes]|uniref:group XIIA secretory phospholipase A2-like n=1 Tax=Pollicipes pollicipes TaxID=41117 RepID=UPI00188579B3|nr:group XIIA secretory phospholipase A2-like [Pollicipes pollicipes]
MNPPHRTVIGARARVLCVALLAASSQPASASFFDELQDAVQNVGTFLNEIGVGATQVLDGWRFIQDFVDSTIDENCDFKCNLGYVPINNTNYIPSSDGCGSLGIKWDTEQLPVEQLSDCCDAHDLCYDTCGADRDYCDLAFKKCLYAACERQKRQLDKISQKACKGTSKLLYTGTLALGCKSYRDAQKRACTCVKQGSKTP